MRQDTDHCSISYTDVLLRNGFVKIPKSSSFPLGGYRKADQNHTIIIRVLAGSWTVIDLATNKKDSIETIHLSKKQSRDSFRTKQ